MKFYTALATSLLSMTLLVAAARADSITFTINDPVQGTAAGSTLVYTATVTAAADNGAEIFLNGIDINSTMPFPVDDDPFYNNFPFDLDPGQSFTGELFDVDVPLDAPIDNYTGTIVLLGGLDGNTYDPLGTADFGTNVTPEPSSLVFLATGLFGAAVLAWRHHASFEG